MLKEVLAQQKAKMPAERLPDVVIDADSYDRAEGKDTEEGTSEPKAVEPDEGEVAMKDKLAQMKALKEEVKWLEEKKRKEGTVQVEEKAADGPVMTSGERQKAVKAAMKNAWDGYRTHAFGADELLPVTRGRAEAWGGFMATMIDSLDTLWLMGLKEEFEQAADYIEAANTRRILTLILALIMTLIPS